MEGREEEGEREQKRDETPGAGGGRGLSLARARRAMGDGTRSGRWSVTSQAEPLHPQVPQAKERGLTVRNGLVVLLSPASLCPTKCFFPGFETVSLSVSPAKN